MPFSGNVPPPPARGCGPSDHRGRLASTRYAYTVQGRRLPRLAAWSPRSCSRRPDLGCSPAHPPASPSRPDEGARSSAPTTSRRRRRRDPVAWASFRRRVASRPRRFHRQQAASRGLGGTGARAARWSASVPCRRIRRCLPCRGRPPQWRVPQGQLASHRARSRPCVRWRRAVGARRHRPPRAGEALGHRLEGAGRARSSSAQRRPPATARGPPAWSSVPDHRDVGPRPGSG